MQEQIMVSDALNSINAGLKSMGDMISQTENQELRQTLQKMRNEAETCQYELFTIAKSKNYYQPAQKATQEEITNVKNQVSQSQAK
jgi:spore coat protein CotF